MTVEDDFRNQVAVVTGAGTGLGLAFATALAGAGAIVALAEIDPQKGALAEQGLWQKGLKARYLPLDVTCYERVPSAIPGGIGIMGPDGYMDK